jgi:hypothetical protein
MVALGANRQLSGVLQGVQAPILAAIWHDAKSTLSVHVGACANRAKVKSEILSVLATAGFPRIRTFFHSPRDLSAPRSMERLVQRFGAGEVLFDPTGAITNAQALVEASRTTRTSLGTLLSGIFFAPRSRTLYVSLDRRQLTDGEKIKVGELANIEQRVRQALGTAFANRLSECPAIRVGFGLPQAQLVPVDHHSIVRWTSRAASAARRFWKPVAIAALFGFGAQAAAAKEPAVDPTNLKITSAVQTANDETGWFFGGALTAPIGDRWGFQAEAAVATNDFNTVTGFAGHIFTRDPSSYLLGVFAAYASEDVFDLDATRLGAEAEIYLNQLTIMAKAGYQFSDAAFLETGFADIELRWYVSDDFALSGGGAFDESTSVARLGAEWRPGFAALPGLALRVDGAWGENDYEAFSGGLTYYFGADASLKDRHRKQDPDSALFTLFQAVQAEQARICAAYGAPAACP